MITKIKASGKNAIQNGHDSIEKKIRQYASQIKESNEKIDEYIHKIDQRISLIISGRLDKFVVMHSEIVFEKNSEIKQLQQNVQKTRMSCLSQNLQRLERTIRNYQNQMERITSIKQMFRKQSQKYKIEMQILKKQLQVCKNREKKLIKRIWTLQQDIKDIYSSEVAGQFNDFQQFKNKNNKKNNSNMGTQFKISHRGKIYNTQPNQSIQSLRQNFQEKYVKRNRPKQYSHMSKHLNDSMQQQARLTTKTLQSANSQKRISLIKSINTSRLPSNIREKYDIYQDLRMNLRRADRNRQLQPRYVQQFERLIKKQDYDIICLHGPKIMSQIQKVMIENYGELKQVDQYSIQLLSMLFRNQNAMKILEIVLFNYSIHAIDEIKINKNHLHNQKQYAQPVGPKPQDDNIHLQILTPAREKPQPSVKRRIKNKIDYHKINFFSQRSKK